MSDHDAFHRALAFTTSEEVEGGYVVDNGGPTNHGVTQTTYNHYRDLIGARRRTVREITPREVSDLYHTLYWRAGRCHVLGPRLAVTHFDWCVNHGVEGALRTLQRAVGARADGWWGPKTRAAVAAVDDLEAVVRYMTLRDRWYDENHAAVNPAAYNGWRRRVHLLWGFLCERVPA